VREKGMGVRVERSQQWLASLGGSSTKRGSLSVYTLDPVHPSNVPVTP
jgi:hypothetical protein